MMRRVLHGFGLGVLIVLALVALVAVVVPKVTGSGTYTITGRSMEPAIGLGSLIVTRTVDPAEVSLGDVITFQLESGAEVVATHRVVGVEFLPNGTRAFVTAGDANEGADAAAVRPEQLRGRLWYAVPLVGWVSAAVTSEARVWLLPLAVSALCAYGTWMLVSGALDRRRAPRDQIQRAP